MVRYFIFYLEDNSLCNSVLSLFDKKYMVSGFSTLGVNFNIEMSNLVCRSFLQVYLRRTGKMLGKLPVCASWKELIWSDIFFMII